MSGRSDYSEIGDMIKNIRSSSGSGHGQKGHHWEHRSRSPSPRSYSGSRHRDRGNYDNHRREREWHGHDGRHGSDRSRDDRHGHHSRQEERWERHGREKGTREWDRGKTWEEGGKQEHGEEYKPPEPSNTVVIRNLPDTAQEDDIRQALQQSGFGMMKEVRLIRNRDTGTSRGFAFVEFPTLDDANSLLKMAERQGIYVHHRRINANYSKNRHSDEKPSDWKCYKARHLGLLAQHGGTSKRNHIFVTLGFSHRCSVRLQTSAGGMPASAAMP
eukprot:m.62006 g.62006  ORF g.62006 m.62006 type:complete len:272 (+) comp35034_c1_seq10:78-893(+)